MLSIALIIPSLDGNVDALLASVRQQTWQPTEIAVVRGVSPNGKARNRGVLQTTAPILVFVDDDAVLGDEHVIENLVEPLLHDPTIGVTGASKLLPPDAPWFQRWTAREVPRIEHAVVYVPLESNPDPPSFYCEITTTCCAMRRVVFEQVGGFDETLVRGVDTEFFVRVRRAQVEYGRWNTDDRINSPAHSIASSSFLIPGPTTPLQRRCGRCCASSFCTAMAMRRRFSAIRRGRAGACSILRCAWPCSCCSARLFLCLTSSCRFHLPRRHGSLASNRSRRLHHMQARSVMHGAGTQKEEGRRKKAEEKGYSSYFLLIMRIAIDARYVNDHFPGIGRYVYNMLRELARGKHDHTLLVLHNPALPNTRHGLHTLAHAPRVELVATNARPFSFGEQITVPRLLHRLHADIFHAPYYVRPYFGLPCPVVVTLYDAIPRLFPSEVSLRARLLFDILTWLAVRDARRIFAISRSARADLIAAYGLAPERVIVTPLAADERFQPQPAERVAAMRAKYDLPERYVLAVGSNKPHKNLLRLIEAFVQLQIHQEPRIKNPSENTTHLVIAGHWDPRYSAVRAFVAQHELHTVVHFLPNVAESDLPALYSGATVFAFPSLYEGFGLPPLEAMACGTPVLCGNTSSLPEVVGPSAGSGQAAALQVNTRDMAALTHGLATLLDDAALRERLRAAGLARAQQFSWRRTAEATVRGMEDAVTRAT